MITRLSKSFSNAARSVSN